MALVLRDLRLSLNEDEALLLERAAKTLGLPADEIASMRIVRMSLDARKKSDIHFKYTLRLDVPGEGKLLRRNIRGLEAAPQRERPQLSPGKGELRGRPVVVGAGPCGMFAALTLARMGYRPIVLERGGPVDRRAQDVERFWAGGPLDEESNVLFGEGGAGTFSDGKLTTRIKDPRSEDVVEALVQFGAPRECAYAAKPHIGTDLLRGVVGNIRAEIERLGGEYRFHCKLTGLAAKDGRLTALRTNRGQVESNACILAVGHSARDVYAMLLGEGVALLPKPFAVGVRVEHPQEMIDKAQYGAMAGHARLGAAEYHLTAKSGGRGVYTFCMCPGGQVVASSSEEGTVVTNGMSRHARDGQNANAAVVVQVGPEDFGSNPLGGVEFQRRMERTAFAASGDYRAPAETVGDFLAGRDRPKGFGAVVPSYRPGVAPVNLYTILPQFVADGIREALPQMGRMLRGFDGPEGVLTGVETRTSAPVRMERDERGQSPQLSGLYPAGEGAGYAGGIVSAAVDGMRAAERLIAAFAQPMD